MTAVIAAIRRMHERLGEPQQLRDFAQAARLSPFHFHRIFRKITSSTPGKFFTALRIAKARCLLLESSMTVTQIGLAVGYSSVGTFTTQFTKLVGLPPGRFRSQAALIADLLISDLVSDHVMSKVEPHQCANGWISSRPDDSAGIAVVGLFRTHVAQEKPIACTFVKPPGPVRIPELMNQHVAYLLAVSVATRATVGEVLKGTKSAGLFVGASEWAHDVTSIAAPKKFFIELKKPLLTDPPILIAFPLLASSPCI
jgi:AraC family transcriptional regulator